MMNMQEWCYNKVWFQGEPALIHSVIEMIYELAVKERQCGAGQLPECVSWPYGWLWQIAWTSEFVTYLSKWGPNTPVIQQIAQHYGVHFKHEYEVFSKCIYGIAVYDGQYLRRTDLDKEDFETFQYDAYTDTFEFENEQYDECDDILQILLERKQNIQDLMI